jgi:hypothetical protein
MENKNTSVQQPQVRVIRGDEFTDAYANNVLFESSVWDLKLVFGQLEQAPEGPSVVMHTAITVPWTAAKLALYYLATQVAAHEITNGKIEIPAAVMPPEIQAPPEHLEGDPVFQRMQDKFRELRAEFVKSL